METQRWQRTLHISGRSDRCGAMESGVEGIRVEADNEGRGRDTIGWV